MSEDNKVDETEVIEYDMEALKSKATLMGIAFSPNIGGKKLKEKIDLHLQEMKPKDLEGVTETKIGKTSVGPDKKIQTAEQKARQLVAVIIIDNDPSEVDNPTIIHGVLNTRFQVGPVVIKKEVPQNVPFCIVEGLRNKTMVKWENAINNITKRPTGNKVPTTKRRYNIQYL